MSITPLSITYWGIPGYVIFWVLTVIAVGLFSRRAYLLLRLMSLGKPTGEFSSIPKRVVIALVNVLGQWGQFKNLSFRDRSSVGHSFLFFGFLLFAPFYLIFIYSFHFYSPALFQGRLHTFPRNSSPASFGTQIKIINLFIHLFNFFYFDRFSNKGFIGFTPSPRTFTKKSPFLLVLNALINLFPYPCLPTSLR